MKTRRSYDKNPINLHSMMNRGSGLGSTLVGCDEAIVFASGLVRNFFDLAGGPHHRFSVPCRLAIVTVSTPTTSSPSKMTSLHQCLSLVGTQERWMLGTEET